MILIRALVILVILILPLSLFADGVQYDADLTKKIEKVIRDVQQIKVGMTRADLQKVFTTEGGISTRKWQRYVYRTCPYIKVDVEFEAVGDEKDAMGRPEDKITKISKPFLEWRILD